MISTRFIFIVLQVHHLLIDWAPRWSQFEPCFQTIWDSPTINILFVEPTFSVVGINVGLCGGLGDFWEMLKENGLEGFRKLELGFASSFEKRKSRNRTHFYPIRTFKELETKQKPDILEKIVQQISRLCFKPPNWKNGLNQALACTAFIQLPLPIWSNYIQIQPQGLVDPLGGHDEEGLCGS